MRIGLVYDLRDDYRALGFSEEEVAEFDNIDTIDQLDGALRGLQLHVNRAEHLADFVVKLPGNRAPFLFLGANHL